MFKILSETPKKRFFTTLPNPCHSFCISRTYAVGSALPVLSFIRNHRLSKERPSNRRPRPWSPFYPCTWREINILVQLGGGTDQCQFPSWKSGAIASDPADRQTDSALEPGKAYGKRPLTRISPNKTVEGALGGFVSCVGVTLALAWPIAALTPCLIAPHSQWCFVEPPTCASRIAGQRVVEPSPNGRVPVFLEGGHFPGRGCPSIGAHPSVCTSQCQLNSLSGQLRRGKVWGLQLKFSAGFSSWMKSK